MTRYRVEVIEESVLRAVVDAPPGVDAMTQEQRRAWLTEAALMLADDAGEPEEFDCYYGNTDFWKAAPLVAIEGEDMACEKFWRDASREALLIGNVADVPEIYRRLLIERSPAHRVGDCPPDGAAHLCTVYEQDGFTPY